MRAFVMPAYNCINPAFETFAMIYYVITSKHLKIYPHCFNLHISYFTSITIKLYLPLLQAFILLLPLFIYHLLYNMLIKYKILQLFFNNTKYLLHQQTNHLAPVGNQTVESRLRPLYPTLLVEFLFVYI